MPPQKTPPSPLCCAPRNERKMSRITKTSKRSWGQAEYAVFNVLCVHALGDYPDMDIKILRKEPSRSSLQRESNSNPSGGSQCWCAPLGILPPVCSPICGTLFSKSMLMFSLYICLDPESTFFWGGAGLSKIKENTWCKEDISVLHGEV